MIFKTRNRNIGNKKTITINKHQILHFKIKSRNLHNVCNNYIQCLKLSLRLIHFNTLKFQDEPSLRNGQKFTVLTLW